MSGAERYIAIPLSTAFSNARSDYLSVPRLRDPLLAEARARSPLSSDPQKTEQLKVYTIAQPAMCDISRAHLSRCSGSGLATEVTWIPVYLII